MWYLNCKSKSYKNLFAYIKETLTSIFQSFGNIKTQDHLNKPKNLELYDSKKVSK